jgi:hypothetical protein
MKSAADILEAIEPTSWQAAFFHTMSETPYTRSELQKVGTERPARGPVCPRCGVPIPQFAELSEADAVRIRDLIGNRQTMMAIKELRSATGCPLGWAKLWVQHGGSPSAVEMTVPCPYCGKPLITALARQCRYCLMDWHDPQNPRKLGSG